MPSWNHGSWIIVSLVIIIVTIVVFTIQFASGYRKAPTTLYRILRPDEQSTSQFASGYRKAPTTLYRILRPDEKPYPGIVAKDRSAQKTVLSHVNCGSQPKYASQYISTSATLDAAKYYKQKKEEEKGLTGLRIAEIDVATLPESCKIIDLTDEATRDKYLGNAVCKNFAKKSEEVLLQCDVPIPCKVIDPPPMICGFTRTLGSILTYQC